MQLWMDGGLIVVLLARQPCPVGSPCHVLMIYKLKG